jgi:hypothetical protein
MAALREILHDRQGRAVSRQQTGARLSYWPRLGECRSYPGLPGALDRSALQRTASPRHTIDVRVIRLFAATSRHPVQSRKLPRNGHSEPLGRFGSDGLCASASRRFARAHK